MSSSKRYYKELNLIRVIACIAVLLYHFNILKGGYLAVCTFFVLSGYLSSVSLFKKEKFSFFSYYKNRLKKLYLPLLLVVFITVCAVSFIPNNLWLNLKVETTSVLLGYNNFWQISANLDYFARHVNSPFIHLWYIAILLQFDLIFPFIHLLLRKIGDKINKILPCILTCILSIIFVIYFYYNSFNQNIMITYYDTFCRVFSLLFGVTLGFIHSYYGSLVPKKVNIPIKKTMFYLYILVLSILFITVDANSKFFAITMIVVSLISCRLIDYVIVIPQEKSNVLDKMIKSFSDVSYEIYLFQYPIIYLFQNVNLVNNLKIILMTISILVLSYILNFALNGKKRFKIIRGFMLFSIISISLYGGYQYIIAKDYTEEMKQLEKQLEENEKIFLEKQKEYELQFKEKENSWNETLENLENGEKDLKNIVTNLPVVGIGDSIMLGTVNNLYKQFPNGYFDAKTSRTAWVANDILIDLMNRKLLGEPIILNLGANGDCPESIKIKIMQTIGDSKVFWVNVTNDRSVNVNDKLNAFAEKYTNLHIIDWQSISSGHPEYFIADGIHLTQVGKEVYTKSIYNAIYQVYLDEYLAKKEELINQHEQEKKNKITFYGNDILLNAFSHLESDFSGSNFNIDDKIDYESLRIKLENSKEDNSLTNKIVFGFDNNTLSLSEYKNLIEICSQNEIYILSMSEKLSKDLYDLELENITVINFYEELINNDYLMADRIHLTDEGNKTLITTLKEIIEK